MLFIKRLSPLVLALSTLTVAATAWAGDEKNVIATVNGKPIYQEAYDEYVRSQAAGAQAKDRERIINELVSRELVYQDAKRKKLQKRDEVRKQLEAAEQAILLNAAIEDAMKAKPITEDELKKEYDQQVAKFAVKEFKARHILLKTEDEAKEVIAELDKSKGANFEKLAKERSTGPSGKNGGDLGWFAANQMVPAFSQAVQSMKKGTYSKTPVQTQFGWHVILKEDERAAEPPSFEAAKPQLTNIARQRRLGEYIEGLKKKAKIDIR